MLKNEKINLKAYKMIWKLIMYKPWLYLLDCILWIIIFVFPLIPGIVNKKFFDILTDNPVTNLGVKDILILLMMTYILRVVVTSFALCIDTIHRFNMNSLVKRNLLENLLDRFGDKTEKSSVGKITNCFRDDILQIEESITWTIDIIGTTIFAIGAIIILFKTNAFITLFVFTPLILVVFLVQKVSEHIEKYRKASREATANVTEATMDTFLAISSIKASAVEKNVLNYLKQLSNKRHRLILKDTVLSQIITSLNGNVINIGTGLILLLAGQTMKKGNFSVGDFTLFIYYLNFISSFTESFGSFLAHYKQTVISFNRLGEILQGESNSTLVEHNQLYLKDNMDNVAENVNVKEEVLKKLEFCGLNYTYNGSDKGIKDITFSLNKGEIIVIAGRTGAGKSTLLKSLIGLLPLKSGHIYWNDTVVENVNDFFVPPVSAYISQTPNLFSESIKKNILLGSAEKDIDLQEVIEKSVLEKDMELLEMGIDTLVGSQGVKLSGGQRKRVAAARMFAHKAELMVIDDISSGLDIETETLLWNRMFKESEVTYVIASNSKSVLRRADRIIVMNEGKIVDQGTLEELQERCEDIKEICKDYSHFCNNAVVI